MVNMKTDAPSAFYLLRFDVVSFSRESKFRVLRNTIIGMTENTFIVKIINRYNVERVVLIFFFYRRFYRTEGLCTQSSYY